MNKIVNFEIADLAKQKNFNEKCYSAYKVWRGKIRRTQTEETALESYNIEYERSGIDDSIAILETFIQCEDYTLAPTASELIDWLWDNHKIILSIKFNVEKKGFVYLIQIIEEEKVKKNINSNSFKERKKCINYGLIEALNLLVYKPNI